MSFIGYANINKQNIATTIRTPPQVIPEASIGQATIGKVEAVSTSGAFVRNTVIGYTPSDFGTATPATTAYIFNTAPDLPNATPSSDNSTQLQIPAGAVIEEALLIPIERISLTVDPKVAISVGNIQGEDRAVLGNPTFPDNYYGPLYVAGTVVFSGGPGGWIGGPGQLAFEHQCQCSMNYAAGTPPLGGKYKIKITYLVIK